MTDFSNKTVSLELGSTLKLILSLRDAYCMLLFCTGYGWKEGGYSVYYGNLAEPFQVPPPAKETEVVTQFVLKGDPSDKDNVKFVFTSENEYRFTASRVKVLKAISTFLQDNVSGDFTLPDVLPLPNDEGLVLTGAKTQDGWPIGISVGRHIKFIALNISPDYPNRTLVDTTLLCINPEKTTDPEVKVECQPCMVYFGGQGGIIREAGIPYKFSKRSKFFY